jgi:hypothetical protein
VSAVPVTRDVVQEVNGLLCVTVSDAMSGEIAAVAEEQRGSLKK